VRSSRGLHASPFDARLMKDWTFMLRAALDDPAMPEEMKTPASLAAAAPARNWVTTGAPRRRHVAARFIAPISPRRAG